jgi:hypothetical protein
MFVFWLSGFAAGYCGEGDIYARAKRSSTLPKSMFAKQGM